jgi:Fe2+ or Zn2+ uptake regulation protein
LAEPGQTTREHPAPVNSPVVTPPAAFWRNCGANGGRVTASRRVTIEVPLGDGRHPNAGDIAVAVRARLPDVAESTAYRTLAASKNSA